MTKFIFLLLVCSLFSFSSTRQEFLFSQQNLIGLSNGRKFNSEPSERKPLITSCINENTGEVIANGSICVSGGNPYCVENLCANIKKGPK